MPIRRLIPFLGILPLAACGPLDRASGVMAGYVSHQICSAVFVAGLDPDAYYRDALAPDGGAISALIDYSVDRADRSVTARVAGLVERRAVYRSPTGCTVLHGAPLAPVAEPGPATAALLPPIAGPDLVEAGDPALVAALDRAFAEPAAPPQRDTKAVVIVHDGRIVAERYAPGYGISTPIHGWSMSKSVTNALIAILVREGKLSVGGPAPVPEWADPSDPRHRIDIDSLLRMTSGIDLGQSLSGGVTEAFDPTAHMVFDTADMGAFAAAGPVMAPPGAVWRYANGNTMLLSRIIRDQTGGDAAGVLRFAHRALFDKLGMTSVTMEFDETGTPIGASHIWATPRDWARFGLLYLDDGVVGGERILPEGWAEYSARETPGSGDFGYGAGFWTNRGTGTAAHDRIAAGMPADSYFARGIQGQYLVIVPSSRLVVLRMGYARNWRDDIQGIERLVADAVAAFPSGS